MSFEQTYEFFAIDRPLTKAQMSELRGVSSRAEITPTRFWNQYHWGDLKADPIKLLCRHFDAYLYSGGWTTQRLVLKLPAASVDAQALDAYTAGANFDVARVQDFVLLDFCREDEEPQDDFDDDVSGLASLVPIRAMLLQGDLRPAYLAWLAGVQSGEVEDDEPEPPLPAGLQKLSAPLESLAALLALQPDLIAAAAEASAPRKNDDSDARRWVESLSAAEKDEWLQRALAEPELPLGTSLLAAFRRTRPAATQSTARTAGTLREKARVLREEREAREEAERQRAEKAAALARTKKLNALSQRHDAAWKDLESLVVARRYMEAADLASDLKDLAERDGQDTAFTTRFAALAKGHPARRSFLNTYRKRTSRYL